MSPRAIADLQRTFEKSRVDFERFKQDAQKEIEAMQTQFELEFRAKLAPVIDEVSKEKGLQFVFGLEQAAIVWWNPAVDISAGCREAAGCREVIPTRLSTSRREALPDKKCLPAVLYFCCCEPTGFNTVRSCESTEYSVNGWYISSQLCSDQNTSRCGPGFHLLRIELS